jgi:GNAT superfamily N-acetyltransferase
VERLPLVLRRATADDYCAILALINGAVQWLPTKGTDQWAGPWPDERRRNACILDDLEDGKTWLAIDGTTVAATITIDPIDNAVWPAERRGERAAYLRRLIVDRRYGGLQVGARLLDWAGDFAADEYSASWIRIDVWTTNHVLHDYFREQGFDDAGLRDLEDEPDYPSRALFQRSTAQRRPDYRDVIRPERRPGWR